MKIYILIVTYNAVKWIDGVFSAFKNLPSDWKILVVDNASEDETVNKLRKDYPFVQIIESKANLGFAKGNNLGLKEALKDNADYVLLLNQDARMDINSINKLIEIQQNNKDFYIVSPLHFNGKGDDLDTGFKNYILKAPEMVKDAVFGEYKKEIYKTGYCNAACWLLSKECLNEIGGFSNSFCHYGEDDNYIQRVQYNNKFIGIAPEVKCFHDRENREKDENFWNDFVTEYRYEILLKLSNPNVSYNKESRKIFARYFKRFLSGLAFLNFSKAKFNWKILTKFLKEEKNIKENLEISRKIAPNFIQHKVEQ